MNYKINMSYLISRDYDLIESIERQVYLDDPIDHENFHWWVCRDKVSICALQILKDRTAYITRAGVLPNYRSFGKHKEMINHRISFAKVYGIKKVITDTPVGEIVGSNNLIKCGFKLYNPDSLWNGPMINYWILNL